MEITISESVLRDINSHDYNQEVYIAMKQEDRLILNRFHAMNALYMKDFIKQVPVKGNKSKMTQNEINLK